jgi:hypothetical protein
MFERRPLIGIENADVVNLTNLHLGQVTKRPMPPADLIANDNGQYHVVANLRSGTTTELKGHASVCPMSVIRERFCNLP